MVKKLMSINRRANVGAKETNYQQYLDKMDKSLNTCILNNIRPSWRNHASVKGWTSMNYPTVMDNPLL
jgi:hypothetical protein